MSKEGKGKIMVQEEDLNNLREEAKKVQALENKLKEIEEEMLLLKDKYLRTLADFDNYKKRADKEKQEIFKFGTENLILQLLPFEDVFEGVLKQMNNTISYDVIHKGVEMLKQEFTKFLESVGVRRIDVRGVCFDPGCHEAVETIEKNDCKEGEIIEEIRSGYSFHNRIIRPALVKVAKKPDCKIPSENDESSFSGED
ncbi:MAG: nucleotide exchange factor GrpE [Elusimicrobia bacterium]|nr:nucleotide exchange factor GrpE [Elusimicrobiota bacterium]